MRTWRFHEPGDISNLVLEEVDTPVPEPDEALIELHCAALNPADRYLVQGQYPRAGAPPFTPGRDGAGVVARAAAGGRFREGDKVCVLGGLTGISRPGTLAEYCTVPETWLAPLPPDWTFAQGAAGPLVHLTAWRALVVCGHLTPEDTVLVTGASGGVGTASVMLAHARGARVIALSRNEEKRKCLASLGAEIVLDSASPTLEKEVRQASGDRPVTLAIEMLGGDYLEKCVRMTASNGRIMVLGLLAGLKAEITVGLLIHKNLRIQGMSVSAFSAQEAQSAWLEILDCFGASKRPLISKVFDFDETQEAFEHLLQGPMGKVVINIADA